MISLNVRQLFSHFTLVFILLIPLSAQSQFETSLEEYIETYKGVAMEHMRTYRIPASIKMAQGILESGFGNSDLAVEANNHFGIKCHGWKGRTFHKDDDKKDECFRAYDDPMESFKDHSLFLTGRERYAFLFEMDIIDYKAWAHGLRKAGYATNPRYPQLLIGVIERNNLQQFDLMVVNDTEFLAKEKQSIDERESFSPPEPSEKNEKEQFDADEFMGTDQKRRIYTNNRIKYVYARENDSAEKIADDLNIWEKEIFWYNEVTENHRFDKGEIVYIQPKRRRSKQKTHTVKPGETVFEISQKYGVKKKFIYKRNALEEGDELVPGQNIVLR